MLLLDEPLSALDARTRAGAARELAAVLRESDAPALLVTHDFAEAAQLGDRVGIIDKGRGRAAGHRQRTRRRAALRVRRRLHRRRRPDRHREQGHGRPHPRRARRRRHGDHHRDGDGAVAVSVYPWEIAIEPAGEQPHGSTQNRLTAEVLSITTVGNRVRLGLAGPQPLVAEITLASAERLQLEPGARVTATWKATATRLVAV